MNSVDAGSTFCDVTLDAKSFSIIDDGKGFTSDEEIDSFFATFGTPHKEGDATYGKFRMGRGQMFSFGRNVWRTGNYRMDVDLKPQEDPAGEDWALGYDFEKVKEAAVGCSIKVDLYDEMLPSRLDQTIRELEKYVHYVDIPVRLNGKLISVDPRKEKWDEETDEAYIKRKTSGNLEVYNLGVLVKDSPSWSTGVAGVVVSKTALRVNFARNDVMADCPIWRNVLKKLKEDTLSKASRQAPIRDHERAFFIRQFVSGETSYDKLRDARLITDVTGSNHPLKKLESISSLSVAKEKDVVGEMAHTRKMAFVFSQECMENFGASKPEDLKKILSKLVSKTGDSLLNSAIRKMVAVPYSDFENTISSKHEPVKDTELSKPERMALKAIREGARALAEAGFYADLYGKSRQETFKDPLNGHRRPDRRVSVGKSETALAWTNGTSDIWVERELLKEMKRGLKGFMKISGILLHEYIHRGPSTGTHEHGIEFYEGFHEYSLRTDVLQKSSAAMFKSMANQLRHAGKGVGQILSALEDRVEETGRNGMDRFGSDVTLMTDEQWLDEELRYEEGIASRPEDGLSAAALSHADLARAEDDESTAPTRVRKARRASAPDAPQMTFKF